MRKSLSDWVILAETVEQISNFGLNEQMHQLEYPTSRSQDLLLSLSGELFDLIRNGSVSRSDWFVLGQALATAGSSLSESSRADAFFYSSSAFYFGGYPASALLSMREADRAFFDDDGLVACREFLTRSPSPTSLDVLNLTSALKQGDLDAIDRGVLAASAAAEVALSVGPNEWVSKRLFAELSKQFQKTNLRSVLPDGSDPRWTPLVESFLNRESPVWDFFPSQIEAVKAGLLTNDESYSLQMPTGAGKTALIETLLFSHFLTRQETKAVLLVPYRALARELRDSLGKELTRMGITSRAFYGGTVTTLQEGAGLQNVKAIIATPESLTALLGQSGDLMSSISLVVCDEGHLLDNKSRGIGLELLLSRFRSREPSPRIIFLSAIVPNIEEINTWLGGSQSTAVKSDYRPTLEEYAVLQPDGKTLTTRINLELQKPSEDIRNPMLIDFLSPSDFKYENLTTGNIKTHDYKTNMARAIATARKALPLGTVAVFAANKGGTSGVLALGKELLKQIANEIPLPQLVDSAGDFSTTDPEVDYLTREYGRDWIGTRTLAAGAIIHHGDLPQETREVLERLVTSGAITLVLCTSTLAEGVNLPIRTMVLYTLSRYAGENSQGQMLARDIKNLVGRAGRPGTSTRGLVICVDPKQWDLVQRVASELPGEPVEGALLTLIRELVGSVNSPEIILSTENLENNEKYFPLIDAIDPALIELIDDEIGTAEFMRIAAKVAEATFAAQNSNPNEKELLDSVFRWRASSIDELRASGRLAWVRATSVKPRMVDPIVEGLLGRYDGWTAADSQVDEDLIRMFVGWAMDQPGFSNAVRASFGKPEVQQMQEALVQIICMWIKGLPFEEISVKIEISVDKLLRIHSKIVSFEFATLVEQAIALLQEVVSEQDQELSFSLASMPDYLRFGVSTQAARELMAQGVRHRRAAVKLGAHPALSDAMNPFVSAKSIAHELLRNENYWLPQLGSLIYQNTLIDTSPEKREPQDFS